MSFDWDRWLFEIRLHPEFYDSTYTLAEHIHRCMIETGEELFEYEYEEVWVQEFTNLKMSPFYDTESSPEDTEWRGLNAEDLFTCLCDLVERGYFEEVASNHDRVELEEVEYDIHNVLVRPAIPEVARDYLGRPVFPQAS
jgi:hypothetical protein